MSVLEDILSKKYVKKAILAKFGNICVIPLAQEINAKEIVEKVKSCLNSEVAVSSVTEIRAKIQKKGYSFRSLQRLGNDEMRVKSLILNPSLHFRVNLPVKNQEIGQPTFFDKSLYDCVSNFEVVYNGSIFCILREADLSKKFLPGAADVRAFLKTILEKEKSWKVETIGPTPLRERIFLLFLTENEDTKKYIGNALYEKGDIWILYSEKSLKKVVELFANMLQKVASPLETFYSGMRSNQKVTEDIDKLITTNESIIKVVEKYDQISFFKLHKHYKLSKKLEMLVRSHYKTLLNYSTATIELEYSMEWAKESLGGSIFGSFLDSYMEELRIKPLNLESFDKCVNYAKGLTQRSYTIKVTLVGAFIGIIGTIFGTLILHLFGI